MVKVLNVPKVALGGPLGAIGGVSLGLRAT